MSRYSLGLPALANEFSAWQKAARGPSPSRIAVVGRATKVGADQKDLTKFGVTDKRFSTDGGIRESRLDL